MRVVKNLHADQELIMRFLDAFGGGAAVLGSNKYAKPGFFLFAYTFMHEYIEENFFKKEVYLLQALEDEGFPPGRLGMMRRVPMSDGRRASIRPRCVSTWTVSRI
jgi:hypothetical protein